MKRSLFTKSLICGSLGLVACKSSNPARDEQRKPEVASLKFYRLPLWAEFLPSLLPQKIFEPVERPAPIEHLSGLPGRRQDESQREWLARCREQRARYANQIRAAEQYFNNWQLDPDTFKLMEQLHRLLQAQEFSNWKLAYDTRGLMPDRVQSLDLIGARLRMSTGSFEEPDDPLLIGPKPKVSSECFDVIMRIRGIDRLFLNYTECPFPSLLAFMRQHAEFDALGLPRDLRPDQLEELIKDRRIDVLDLSGYELSQVRDEMVDVAIRQNVRWLMFSNAITFDFGFIKVKWEQANKDFRGVIGLQTVGLVDYPVQKSASEPSEI